MSEQTETGIVSLASASSYQEVIWAVTPHHPWRRAFATSYDFIAFGILGTAILGLVIGLFSTTAEIAFNGLPDNAVGMFIWYFLSGLIAVPLMAFFLSEFGATPGKWIWGIKLERKDEGQPSFLLMLKRELMLFFVGYGANLGPIILGLGLVSRATLLKTGETSWDATYATRVLYRESSAYRIVAGVSALLCLALLASSLPGAS